VPYADLGTVKLHYIEEGKGSGRARPDAKGSGRARPDAKGNTELALLLHGFPDYHGSWRAQLPALAEAGFRAVAPDLRGYNLSDKPEGVSAYDIDLLVDDVFDLIRELGEPRAHLIGHDWGGIIAWNFAMRHPEWLDRLAILNVPHPGHMPLRWLLDPVQMLKSWYVLFFQLPGLPEQQISNDDFKNLKRLYFGQKKAFDPDEIDGYIEAARRTGNMRGPINYYRALMRLSILPTRRNMRRIDHPVLVLWGDEDRALQKSLAEPPVDLVTNAEVIHFPDAGHWVHKEKPHEVNALLTSFLTDAN
jgi:epoxide hydrolase 4